MTALGDSAVDAFPVWLSEDAPMAEALALDSTLLDLCPPLTGVTGAVGPAVAEGGPWGAKGREIDSSAFAAVSPCASLSPPSPTSGSCLSSPEWTSGAEGAWGLESWAFPALVEGMTEARAGGGAALAALEEELQSTGAECALVVSTGEGAAAESRGPLQPPTKKRKRSEQASAGLPSEEELCSMTSAQLAALREGLQAPLSPEEEARLAASWRRVKNREYSRVSRAKKSRRLEALEARVRVLEEERRQLAEENRGLREKLLRVAAAFQEARAACTRRPPTSAAAAGVCLFAVLLCVGIVGLAPFSSAATHEAALAGRIHRTGRAILTTGEEEVGASTVALLWASLWPFSGEESLLPADEEVEEAAHAPVGSVHGQEKVSSGTSEAREKFAAQAVACVEDVCNTEAWAPANVSASAAA